MSKAYSNKALPAGTILREWRLEQVLGVGGFGIVYKARGIYFDELVAIKEYFPSSISERDEDATVVPIDSDAEEVHALGLKKFVEEAKLLWNLSTPTRHPHIVSVRSLFEIHGTAYMVMDFEDGTSLSKLLKSGKRWNEASLIALIRPIAEGLERAHRVGVLHRDIKPPNILVNDGGRSVLIDFGSARFESGEATSTTVTFHTPPYAAIEQYVRTYEQGPWTDIYALGVVLHECITGEKPPEVLERMHAGAGKPLAGDNWPGYGKPFLAWVDAAMAIKPNERPQSISKWLELLDNAETREVAAEELGQDGDRTTVSPMLSGAPEIVPVAPSPSGFSQAERPVTAVPSDPKDAKFRRIGENTRASRMAVSDQHTPDRSNRRAVPKGKGPNRIAIGGAALAAVAILGAGGWYLTRGSNSSAPAPEPAERAVPAAQAVAPVAASDSDGVVRMVQALADDATRANAPAAAVKRISEAAAALQKLDAKLQTMAADPKQAAAANARHDQMAQLAHAASGDFAAILGKAADGRVQRLAADLPWANPRNASAALAQPPARQNAARTIRYALAALHQAAADAKSASDPAAALTAARQALAASTSYNSAIGRAYRASKTRVAAVPSQPVIAGNHAAVVEQAAPAPVASVVGPSGQASQLWPQKYRTFNSTVKSARDLADDVVHLGRGSEPSSDAAKQGWRVRQANVTTAQNYVKYLDTLTNSMRGNRSEEDVDKLIASAEQTRRYLVQLKAGSDAAKH